MPAAPPCSSTPPLKTPGQCQPRVPAHCVTRHFAIQNSLLPGKLGPGSEPIERKEHLRSPSSSFWKAAQQGPSSSLRAARLRCKATCSTLGEGLGGPGQQPSLSFSVACTRAVPAHGPRQHPGLCLCRAPPVSAEPIWLSGTQNPKSKAEALAAGSHRLHPWPLGSTLPQGTSAAPSSRRDARHEDSGAQGSPSQKRAELWNPQRCRADQGGWGALVGSRRQLLLAMGLLGECRECSRISDGCLTRRRCPDSFILQWLTFYLMRILPQKQKTGQGNETEMPNSLSCSQLQLCPAGGPPWPLHHVLDDDGPGCHTHWSPERTQSHRNSCHSQSVHQQPRLTAQSAGSSHSIFHLPLPDKSGKFFLPYPIRLGHAPSRKPSLACPRGDAPFLDPLCRCRGPGQSLGSDELGSHSGSPSLWQDVSDSVSPSTKWTRW